MFFFVQSAIPTSVYHDSSYCSPVDNRSVGLPFVQDNEEPIDFLGSSASARVSATDPKRFAKKAPKTAFPVGEDGKLLIEDEVRGVLISMPLHSHLVPK